MDQEQFLRALGLGPFNWWMAPQQLPFSTEIARSITWAGDPRIPTLRQIAEVKKQPPNLTAGEFNRSE